MSREDMAIEVPAAFPQIFKQGEEHQLAYKVMEAMDELRIADALDLIMTKLREVCLPYARASRTPLTRPTQINELMTAEMPFARDTPRDRAILVRATILETVRICAILLQPIIPQHAQRVLDGFGLNHSERTLELAVLGAGPPYWPRSGFKVFEVPPALGMGWSPGNPGVRLPKSTVAKQRGMS